METVFIGLGSNMGDRAENLRKAIEVLGRHMAIEKKSSLYESEPMYVQEQPQYLNMVLSGTTELSAHELLVELKHIEEQMGRAADTHNLPRPIDLDILLYGAHVIDSPSLTVPHPRMQSRAFVLVPLEEIVPLHQCPPHGKPVADMLDELGGYEDIVWRAQVSL